MLKSLINSLVGTRFEREMKKLQPIVDEIKRHEERLADVTAEALKAQTGLFRERIAERTADLEERIAELRDERRYSEDPNERADLTQQLADMEEELRDVTQEVLDDLLPEAFATVREACRRLLGEEIQVTGNTTTWDMVPYDVQLIGGIVLHQGKIAEMATGEGKTLVATMPLYLNALPGKGAHLVTVNDYLARRDASWMGTVFEYLGLTVGCIDDSDPGTEARREAYACDITYGTNNEFGFDYLRDNMVVRLEDRVQRGHVYAIIDEVDSVLIDEARTPLIISGPAGRGDEGIYGRYNAQVADLVRRQGRIVRELISEGEELLEESREEDDASKEFQAGQLLLAAQRGDPRNRRLLKLLNEMGVKQLVQKTEGELMREKRLHEVDEMLLYSTDEKGHTIQISDQGLDVLSPSDPEAFVVPDLSQTVKKIEDSEDLSAQEKREKIAELEREYAEKSEKIHIIHQLVKAHALYEKDVEYVVEDGQIVIVDEFTGRKMPGRRWSDGLHQAVEAKEGVTVQGETQTLATITIQNYFRMYDKLAGMTGTAETEEGEFHEIYGLEVVVIPTNRPVRRIDHDDVIFRTKREKYSSLLEEIERLHERELPILVGTTSVEVSEMISRMLRRRGLTHEVLNAKNHQREAQIVAGAGQPAAITIATNMAGRGTDIKLGEGVVKCDVCGITSSEPAFGQVEETPDLTEGQIEELGCQVDPPCGLQILGTERHEARRIDRQLRGRSGRQGDPGSSRFFVSLEDDLMRLFGSERIAKWLDRAGMKEGEVISDPWMTKALERAQKKVELQNFEARKKLLEYDDVMNQQREVIYDLRLFALEGGEDLKGEAWEMIEAVLREDAEGFLPDRGHPETWDLPGLREKLVLDYFLLYDALPEEEVPPHELPWSDASELVEEVVDYAHQAYRQKIESFGEHWERILSFIVLSVIDDKWKDHLYELDHLRDSIRYRAWGQKDPLIEYKKEAFDEFVAMMTALRRSVANLLFRAQIEMEDRRQLRAPQVTALSGPDEAPPTGVGAGVPGAAAVPGRDGAGAEEGEPAYAATGVATSAAEGAQAQAAPGSGRVVRPDEPLDVDEEPGRNDPCPCGSGKKYKKCHGRLS
ncbi:MAG TPA: preprotein translocase subunit SecA [Gemmatimonadota bacterium]|nr:preprotein translocase subunit SecA [Gemmatimonadota bacterium]